jgi:hypothetical protein
LSPVVPQSEDGIRTEPPVSVPSVAIAIEAATATAEPRRLQSLAAISMATLKLS